MRLAVVLTLLLAAPASAASVSGADALTVTAADGELNTLTVEASGTGVFLTDTTSDLTTDAASCASDGPRKVFCEGTHGVLTVDLGDLNDQLTVTGTFLTLDLAGGDGNDAIDTTAATPFARDAQFSLTGNDGDDELRGGRVGEGFSGGPGSDVMDGGGGLDEADYSDHAEDVVVDLRHAGGQGADGEADVLTDVEAITGGLGDDVLIGDAGANLLRGNQGHDKLRGGAGSDDLEGDGEEFDPADPPPLGGDDVSGGAGVDVLFAGPGSTARCGAGRDHVTPSGGFVAPDCEFISALAGLTTGPLRSRRDTLRLRLGCGAVACRGRVRIVQDGTLAARGFRVGKQRTKTLRLRLRKPTRAGRVRVVIDLASAQPVRYDTRL